MRKLIIISLFLFACNVFLYSEESAENVNEQSISSVIPTDSQVILYNPFYSVLNPGAFSFSDGSTINYRRLKENLALVPENGKFIRRADTWNILYYISTGTAVALVGGVLYNGINSDSRTSERNIYMFSFGGIGAGTFGYFASSMVSLNLNKAIHNYNMTVTGRPVNYR